MARREDCWEECAEEGKEEGKAKGKGEDREEGKGPEAFRAPGEGLAAVMVTSASHQLAAPAPPAAVRSPGAPGYTCGAPAPCRAPAPVSSGEEWGKVRK